jgi:hypothetical protein
MERNDSKKLKITAGLVAAAVIGLTMQAEGARRNITACGAERALVYGSVDGTWVQRTAKLVANDPAAAAEIARIATSESVDSWRRGLALDALAQAGSGAAQAAMRTALTSPAVQADPAYPLMVARLYTNTARHARSVPSLTAPRRRGE